MKTSELTGAALDWVVAKCEGNTFAGDYPHLLSAGFRPPKYSTDWAQGGPIIEREGLNVYFDDVKLTWAAAIWKAIPGGGELTAKAKDCPTPLIAAMRCYVASKLGDDVDVPKELQP